MTQIKQLKGFNSIYVNNPDLFWANFIQLLENTKHDKSEFFFFFYNDDEMNVMIQSDVVNREINKITRNKTYIFSFYEPLKQDKGIDNDNDVYQKITHVEGEDKDLIEVLRQVFKHLGLDKNILLPLLIKFDVDNEVVTVLETTSYGKYRANEDIIKDIISRFDRGTIVYLPDETSKTVMNLTEISKYVLEFCSNL